MYPYQRTPMGNPYISPIYPYIVGAYGLTISISIHQPSSFDQLIHPFIIPNTTRFSPLLSKEHEVIQHVYYNNSLVER